MKMQSQSILFGIKASEGNYEGTAFSSTTFYLPAEFATGGNVKAIGLVTVPYKFGDASEYKKWEHLEKAFPASGVPVVCDFDVVVGKDANGRDAPKIVLLGIKQAQNARAAA